MGANAVWVMLLAELKVEATFALCIYVTVGPIVCEVNHSTQKGCAASSVFLFRVMNCAPVPFHLSYM